MKKDSVLFFGDINVDNIYTIEEIPEPGRDGFASFAEMRLGGAVCNSAVILQRLGHPAALLGAVGNDMWSDYVYNELKKGQIDAEHVIEIAGEKTGLIFIAVTPNGERTMFCYRGANNAIKPEDLSDSLLDNVSLVQLSGYAFLESPQMDTAWELVSQATARGIPVSMDTGLDPVLHNPETIHKLLPYLKVLITGKEEAQLLSSMKDYHDQMNYFLSFGLTHVGIKLGGEGAILGSPDGVIQQKAFPVTVKDTTSAGDAFSAGLIFGFLHHFSPNACLTLANALGGLATTVYGAAWIGRDEVLPFLINYQNATREDKAFMAIPEIIEKVSKGS